MTLFDEGGVLGRRGFVTGLGAPLGALALWNDRTEPTSRGFASTTEGPLLERTLGRTGLHLPIVSMGVMNASMPMLVARSHERGVRLFDTAWFYQRGMNETMVGDVVQQLGCRQRVAIATKIYLKEVERDLYLPSIKALFLERFRQSLERLKTSYVDILYYHAGSDVREINNPPILEALTELKREGKVRFCGVSLHGDQAAMLDDMRRSGFYDVALVIFNAAMGHREIAAGDPKRLVTALEAAAAAGLGLIAMKTQCGGGGGWAEKAGGGEIKKLNHTALLKWVLRHPFITTTVPGYTTFEQMEQSISVARGLEYTPEEKAFLGREGLRIAESFCALCGRCVGQCPRGVDVPSLMRSYMYAYQYRNLELALATQATVPERRGLGACVTCGECRVRCPRRLDISGRLAAMRTLLSAYA